ncbi:FAD-dependent oxidoreductase [Novosphingobium sp.]|uniref:FAD-dependent oxidoreductase n=1 Tax=Novosphingobium sp. TaxID=1874826 RepID=UPI0025CEE0C4|nr:FAD-dependent oxidoreductase [Novosphingobium sp.]
MQSSARVVIIGGGIMGASLLYHLALEGWTDCLLIEKDELTSGSTWHAAGQCPSITGSFNLAKIHAYSNDLYPRLEGLTGQYVSWHKSGGIRLATNERELAWFKYINGFSKIIGFDMAIIPPEEIRRINPFVTTDGVIAGAYTTGDGHADPSGICNAMAIGAKNLGAKIVRHNRVTGLTQLPTGEWDVLTEQGTVRAEIVVNAAGCYARQVAQMAGIDIPVTNMEHHYIVTDPIPAFMERDDEIPVMRCPHVSGYFRQEQKSGLIGIYEDIGLAEAWAPKGQPEWESTSELFIDDLDRISKWLERAIERMPVFGEVGIRRIVNGAIPHTPDGAPLLGPAAGLRNFWHCCGTSFGIAQGGGSGKYLAQWIVHGDADINMAEFDPRRYGPFADEDYSRAKVFLDYRMTFTTRPPGEEEPDGRPQKTSPLYERLAAAGAVYGETYGWERPKWFSLDGRAEEAGYHRTNVFEVVAAEVKAVAERVGVLDLSGFAKYEVTGPDAEAFLNRICANRMPKKQGGIGLVHPLSRLGRIYGEMTVTRMADDHFYCLSAAAAEQRDEDHLRQSLLPHEQVTIRNVTMDRGVLVLSGPRARDVLAKLTDADLSNEGFRWLSGQDITIAGLPVRALRVSYVGEGGWELHPAMSDLAALYDTVWAAGQDFGIANYGLYAVNTMRMEKGYKAWGSELTNELTMIEAGMDRFIQFKKDHFVGKQATLDAPDRFRIVYGEVDATDVDVRGAEPCMVYGKSIGLTTSGGYGHRVGKSLFFACVPLDHAAPGSRFAIQLQGELREAKVLEHPAYDSDNTRMKA